MNAGLLVDLRERPLPEDVGVAIRIAAGECAARDAAVADSGIPPDAVVEACVFFLQQTLFAPGSDSYRILGVHPGDPQERLREHYRWLMKWLHPDRNQDGWETLYADRVNADLKTPDRRAAYDSRLPAAAPAMVPTPTLGWRVPVSERAQRGPLLSGRIVRNLPGIVLGLLAAMAMLVVAATYWARTAMLMDEPTAALGLLESRKVLSLARQIADRGLAVVLISHILPHVMELADRVVVMRHGQKVAELTDDISSDKLIALIVGVDAHDAAADAEEAEEAEAAGRG